MNIWTVTLTLLAATVISYGLAVLAGFTMPNDLPRNLIVFLLVVVGGVMLLAFVIVVIVAVSRGVTV